MRILFADDHGLVREGIKPFLEELAESVDVVEAADFAGAKEAALATDSLDLMILDLKMPGMNGFSGITALKEARPNVPIVILSGHYNRKDIMTALDHGVSGYIPKTTGGLAMVNALKLVLAGETYLPSTAFTGNGEDEPPPIGSESGLPIVNQADLFPDLSPREREILTHVVNGETNKEIARDLDLQEITVKIHVRNVYRKIGSSNRAQAVKIALQAGWDSDI